MPLTPKMKDFCQQFSSEEMEFLNLSSSTLLDLEEDPSFVPDCSAASESDISQVPEENNVIEEKKFVICESQLDKLLGKMFCPECAESSLSSTKTISGTNIGVKMKCPNNHVVLDWSSQKQIGKLFSFNLLLCSSIIASGKNTPSVLLHFSDPIMNIWGKMNRKMKNTVLFQFRRNV